MGNLTEKFSSNFAEFTKDWQRLNAPDLRNRLKNFFDKWQSCACSPNLSSSLRSTELCADKLGAFFTEMIPHIDSVRDKRKTGDAANVWKVSRLGCDEIKVSSVLAWFLDCHAEHGQGSAILGRILDEIHCRNNLGEAYPSSEIIRRAPYWVNVESCPNGDKSSRIDIEIEGKHFLLFIEVKIFAPETGDQLDRYLNIGRSKSAGRPWGIIFLTSNGNNSRKSVIVNGTTSFACVSWRDIANVFKSHTRSLSPCFSKSIMNQFAEHIQEFRRD